MIITTLQQALNYFITNEIADPVTINGVVVVSYTEAEAILNGTAI